MNIILISFSLNILIVEYIIDINSRIYLPIYLSTYLSIDFYSNSGMWEDQTLKVQLNPKIIRNTDKVKAKIRLEHVPASSLRER